MAKRSKKRVQPEPCPFDDLAPRFYWGPLDLPKVIFLAPIQLRSRKQYYKDICEDVARELDYAWESGHNRLFAPEQEHRTSSYARSVWQAHSPFWWGLNDIVGYIECRYDQDKQEIRATLFLTAKRRSCILRDKRVVAKFHDVVSVSPAATNTTIRQVLLSMLEKIRRRPELKKLHVQTRDYENLIRCIDFPRLFKIYRK